MVRSLASAAVFLALVLPSSLTAQDQGSAPLPVLPGVDGAPPPVHPASITRDDLGRATVRAIRLDAPLVVDGVLDEDVYREMPSFGGFVQVTPVPGGEPTQRSEVWVLHDDTHVYVVCRCHDTAPPEEWVANELRRDTNGLRNNDHFGVMLDTFYDRRSGFAFYSNPLGARADYSVVDEGSVNTDWNPVWDVKTGTFDGGWTMEMAIPFKSLRYRSGTDQMWGFQLRRSIRRNNEWLYLNPVPAFMAGPQGLNRVSAGGTIVGLDLPTASRNLEIKPYGITGFTNDRVVENPLGNQYDANAGLDLKYGVTANLTADVTVNTDFAQVEVDEQQVNLTRFNLFFPEKREFFLEGRGVFDFGRGGQGFRPGGGGGDAPFLFYSRRIGFDQGGVVPIDVGGRLTGKVGDWGVGLVNIQTGGDEALGAESTNFTVVRVKRDILRRSAIGAMMTNRSVSATGTGSNQAYGLDLAFLPTDNVRVGGYWARTETEGLDGDAASWMSQAQYEEDLYSAEAEYLVVGEAFNPEVGFARRRDFRKSSAALQFSPRPASWEAIRQITLRGSVDYFESGAGVIESREQRGRFNIEFENSDQVSVNVSRSFERLFEGFAPGRDLFIEPGDYDFANTRVEYQFGPQRRIAGNVSVEHGSFYDGTLTSFGVSQGRVVVTNHLSVEPGITVNQLDLDSGELRQTLLRTRADYSFSPRMFASALVQYNSNDRTFSSNLRYRWEYSPGSEIFLVWTDERDTLGRPEGIGLRNRSLTFKVTRLFQF